MHYSTTITKLANLFLAFGLTIATQFSAAGSGYAPNPGSPLLIEQSNSVTGFSLTSGPALSSSSSGVQTMAGSILSSSCDRCRTICARNCASYACRVCMRSIKCGPTVQTCLITKRKS
jgi:hypothetical protein